MILHIHHPCLPNHIPKNSAKLSFFKGREASGGKHVFHPPFSPPPPRKKEQESFKIEKEQFRRKAVFASLNDEWFDEHPTEAFNHPKGSMLNAGTKLFSKNIVLSRRNW